MPPHIVRYPPIQCNTRERCDQLQIPAAPPAWRAPEGPDNLPAAPMGGGRAWPGFEGKLHHTQRRKRRRCGGRRRVQRARLRCPWAGGGAWPGFEATRRAKLAARRARGRAAAHGHTKQPGLARHTTQAPGPTAPRTPAVPQATKQQGLGAGGQGRASRSTTPSRRLACGDLAGGRTRRRPEHQRRHTQREPDTRKPRPADAGRGQPTQSGGKV